MKSWSYRQITAHAEKEIRQVMKNEAEAEESHMKQLWWAQAYGIYNSWHHLTMGWQKEGDNERLEALTKTEND